jgi:type IV secretory pathway protease TraF
VFHAPTKASPEPKEFVKRLIGLPGETVSVTPDQVLIDGRPLFPIISREEADQPEESLRVAADSRVEVQGTRLLIDGECVLALSPTGNAQIMGDALYVEGERVTGFEDGEMPRPAPLPGAFRTAGHGVGTAFYSSNGGAVFVMRGRRLAIRPGYVAINGKPLSGEDYVSQTPRYRMPPTRLGKDEFFVLGDNRNLSLDSHRWGALDANAIVGKAWAMFWPLDRVGLLN